MPSMPRWLGSVSAAGIGLRFGSVRLKCTAVFLRWTDAVCMLVVGDLLQATMPCGAVVVSLVAVGLLR